MSYVVGNIPENAIPDGANENYASLGELSDTKCRHLQQMYHDFIPQDRYLPFTE